MQRLEVSGAVQPI